MEIRNVLAWTAQLSDSGALSDYVAVWTEEAIWEIDGRRTVGKAAIARKSRRRREMGLTGPRSGTMHVVSTVVTELLDPAEARARSAFQFLAQEGEQIVVRLSGWYDDYLVREQGRWKIRQRTIMTLAAQGMLGEVEGAARE